jgi:hypothetical protein
MVAVVVAAGLLGMGAWEASAQTVKTKKAHVGRFEYQLVFEVTNTAAARICAIEAQLISHFDSIEDREAPAGWSASGLQNAALDFVAQNADDCIAPGGVKSGFELIVGGVLPATVEMCFLGALVSGVRPLVGKCVSLSIK